MTHKPIGCPERCAVSVADASAGGTDGISTGGASGIASGVMFTGAVFAGSAGKQDVDGDEVWREKAG